MQQLNVIISLSKVRLFSQMTLHFLRPLETASNSANLCGSVDLLFPGWSVCECDESVVTESVEFDLGAFLCCHQSGRHGYD